MRGEDPNDPADPRNKERTRESVSQVRELLMEWDPLGVAGAAEAADEYDCMISPLLHQLHDGDRQRQVRRWLEAEVADHFGMKIDRRRETALAAALTDWWRVRSASSQLLASLTHNGLIHEFFAFRCALPASERR